jgi:succinate dehydrogenase / fumarate reductase membrane anchor subunit
VLAVGRFFYLAPSDYQAWVDFFQPLWWRVLTMLLWLALTLHAWLGIRDVFKDYVPNDTLRSVLLKGLVILLWLYLAWAAYLLFA